MWRARSDGDDRPLHNDDNHSGAGGDPLPDSADEWTSPDPRSEPTGRKIRRIEAGPPGSGSDRNRPAQRSNQSLARRQVGSPGAGSNGEDGSVDSGASPTSRRGRHIGRPDHAPPSEGVFGLSGGGLPPLRQPTGELPVVPGPEDAGAGTSGSHNGFEADKPSGWPTDLPADEAMGATGVMDAIDSTAIDPASGPGRFAESMADAAEDRSIDLAMPSAMSAAGSARPPTGGRGDVAASIDGLGSPNASSMPSAFPDAAPRDGDTAFPSWSAGSRDAGSGLEETMAMGSPGGGPAPRAVGFGAGPADSDRRPGAGGASASRLAGAQRLQETEIKLAGRQSAPAKPKEPNRLLLALAILLVLLAGAAVAWWLTRGDDTGGQDVEADAQEQAVTETTLPSDQVATPETPAPVTEEPILDIPTLSLVDVPPGPLDPTATYSLDLIGEPPGSMLQVVVDDVPQGEPGPVLPDLILPSGRHTLVVNVSDAAGVRTSSPVEVYVLDAVPGEGYIANLASVDIVNEGWDEAIRRFDGFRSAGHQNLRLLPITPGFWNIFVPDLGDLETTTTYCESFGLAVPDDCFPRNFDPATYQGPAAAASTGPATDDGAAADDGAMTDDGEGTPTSTTTGG